MKRIKLASGEAASSSGGDVENETRELPRKSAGPSGGSRGQPVENISRSSIAIAKRKSCPAIGPSSMTSTIAAFLTPERVKKILEDNEEMSEADKAREIRRVTLCLSSLVKAQGQGEFVNKTVFEEILKVIQTHADSLNEQTWNIAQQAIQYATTPRNCGTFFSTLEDLVNELLIHRPTYANAIIQILITKFVRPSPAPGATVEDDPGPSIAELKCFDISVKLVSRIVETIGVKRLNKALLNLMSSSYPYVLKPSLTHYYYVRNLLSLNRLSGNSLTYSVLSVIFHKLTHLDSLLPRHILESDHVEGIVLPKQEKTGGSPSTNPYIISIEDADELIDEVIKSYKKISDEVEQSQQMATLDTCLAYLISFLSTAHESINFNSLLSIFETEVLPTFNTNCVQFALFYVINLKEEYLNAFLDFLWKKFLNISTPLVLRILSVGYIAGVLARSTKVDRRTLKRWVSRMSSFAHEYLNTKSESATCHWANVNILAHGSFYAVCQAIFYIFAFRHFELIYGNVPLIKEEENKPGNKPNIQGLPPPNLSSSFMYALNLQRLITCDLNPLKACIPSIAKTFVNIAHVYQISYCKTVLERNSRASIRNMICENMRDGASSGESVNLLNDSFFPFDPLMLPYSKMIVEDTYRPYDGNSLALSLVGESISNASWLPTAKPEEGSTEDDDNCDDFDLEGEVKDEVDSGNILLVCE